jgi:predicted nuclease of restriction endonuclease-like (RecB) superfamily
MVKKENSRNIATKVPISHIEYANFIIHLKSKIRSSQLKAAISVNREMIKLYWEIGKEITEKQEAERWGTSVLEKIAKDLQNEFPGVAGFSRSSLFRMKAFYSAYKKVAQAVRLLEEIPFFSIPWGHNIAILEQLKTEQMRLWYAKMTISEGWSRSALLDSIKSNLYSRHGNAITNFKDRLPAPYSRLAHETLKDPYNFDFLELTNEHIERDIELGLLQHIEKFIQELGQGFSFVGRQVPIQVSDKDFYIDLLFYHLQLRCFVVIELKATDFKPEHAGKMNFYLSAVDDLMKHPTDNPTIGILICRTKDNYIAEYALRDIHKPMGVTEYETKIVSSLPNKLKGKLPTIEEIEAELSAVDIIKSHQTKSKRKNKRSILMDDGKVKNV